MIGKDKQEDLDHLRRFILEPILFGYFTHLWYGGLRTTYPFQFIQLMEEHRNFKKEPKEIKSDDHRIKEAIQLVNRLYFDFKKYIIHPPENEGQRKDFDRIINKLEDLLLKQNKEN